MGHRSDRGRVTVCRAGVLLRLNWDLPSISDISSAGPDNETSGPTAMSPTKIAARSAKTFVRNGFHTAAFGVVFLHVRRKPIGAPDNLTYFTCAYLTFQGRTRLT